MGRGSQAANDTAQSAQQMSAGFNNNAGALYGTLAPQLEAMAAHPTGFSPTDKAAMTTSALQTGGGTQAAATGAGALLGARKRNAGAAASAVADSARTAGQQVSERAVDVQGQNAQLKAKQQQAALGQMGDLYGTGASGATRALSIVPEAVNADTQARKASWDWMNSVANLTNAVGNLFTPIKIGGGSQS